MAKLWLARTRGVDVFDKLIVVKEVLPHLASDRQFFELFLDEARVCARLHHPNIVQVFDAGVEEGAYFLAMEFVHGHDVHELLERARRADVSIPVGVVVAIGRAMCAGLHHAHELKNERGEPLGLVHRDVSPSNVLVSYDGNPKVTDFGIAHVRRPTTPADDRSLRGKLPYMSPEQCRNRPLDRRSDVYSIGVVLFELLTRRRAHERDGDSDFEVMRSICEAPVPSPSQLRPDCPPELSGIVQTSLAKDPDDRYATAREMQIALEAFARDARLDASDLEVARLVTSLFADEIAAWDQAREHGMALVEHVTATRVAFAAPSAPKRRARWVPWTIAASCAIALGGVGALGMWNARKTPAEAARSEPTNAAMKKATNDATNEPPSASVPAPAPTAAPHTIAAPSHTDGSSEPAVPTAKQPAARPKEAPALRANNERARRVKRGAAKATKPKPSTVVPATPKPDAPWDPEGGRLPGN